MTTHHEDQTFLRTLDQTYLELLSSLVNTLIDRLVKIMFKEEIFEIQQSLINYERFKAPKIKYSNLLNPLIQSMEQKNEKLPHYFSTVINQYPERQSSRTRKHQRRVYSSKQDILNRKTNQLHIHTSSSSFKNRNKPLLTRQKTQKSKISLPNSLDSKSHCLKSHNYQKQVNKAYDKIIGTVISSKGFRKKKYMSKVNYMVKNCESPEDYEYSPQKTN